MSLEVTLIGSHVENCQTCSTNGEISTPSTPFSSLPYGRARQHLVQLPADSRCLVRRAASFGQRQKRGSSHKWFGRAAANNWLSLLSLRWQRLLGSQSRRKWRISTTVAFGTLCEMLIRGLTSDRVTGAGDQEVIARVIQWKCLLTCAYLSKF